MLSLFLQLAIVASGAGAFIGGYVLIHPAAGKGMVGVAASDEGLRALGGALLLGHATALAILAQSPPIGACLAAGLGAAWFGAAAGRLIAIFLDRGAARAALLRIGFEVLMGLLLWAPLWTYLRMIRAARRFGGV